MILTRANRDRQVVDMAGTAQKACRDGFSVLYRPAGKLFGELDEARVDGSLGKLLPSLARVDVLVVDDFAMNPLEEHERRLFLEICDDRYRRRIDGI